MTADLGDLKQRIAQHFEPRERDFILACIDAAQKPTTNNIVRMVKATQGEPPEISKHNDYGPPRLPGWIW